MQGAGNDFIIIDNTANEIPYEELSSIAKDICRRRLALGADGMMVVEKPEKGGDFKMIFFNSDGSEGEMCGNGARCIARYGYEHKLAGEVQKIETISGMVKGFRITTRLYEVKLNDISCLKPDIEIEFDGEEGKALYEEFGNLTAHYAEMGNPGLPHAVVLLDYNRHDREMVRRLGKYLRYYKDFPKGANVNFCNLTAQDTAELLTYERGVEDFTLACGTGSGSTAAVLTSKGLVSGKDTKLINTGGTLHVSFDDAKDPCKGIYLLGPTMVVCEGELIDSDIEEQ